ncbi:MAG: anthranilate synthase [Acidithiobacillales bacterium SM1_46]|jgi:anthranilate synthase component 1|nr:MAG: anthranilate synthase [Acidithiobacillales bacterium SM1_46]
MSLDQAEFSKFASQGFNRIPLMREVLADLDTPLSVYLKLARGPYSYLFESVQGGEKWGRYSIIGLPARTVLRIRGDELTVEKDGSIVERENVADPLEAVRRFKSRYRVPAVKGLPRFTGGLVGYFGYETIRYIEPRVGAMQKPDAIGAPDILLMVSDEVVVFDNLKGRLYVVIHANPEIDGAFGKATRRLDELVAHLGDALPHGEPVPSTPPVGEADFVSAFSQSQFEQAVERSLEYIRAGDIMQVVLSQRLAIPYAAAPLDLYRALRTLNPSPYMFFVDLKDFHVVGSSPEILVRVEDGQVTVRPIAGTRPRGRDEVDDKRLEEELLADPKERAEHIMLVDLGRNDIGRVSTVGSVRVTDQMVIERYSHVMHIVSNVTGALRPDMDAIDVLRATFPAGTVSGAPKVRAMEIIEELEPTRRGVYAGAVGYLSWAGNMDTAIAIRTAVIKDGTLYIQAGAGIVADSVPRNEWNETMNKARAIFRAVAMATAGMVTHQARAR